MNIEEKLLSLSDKEYKSFCLKLTPGLEPDSVIGVRVPLIRDLAKEFIKSNDYISFINDLPHKYYEEYILHSILLCNIKDYNIVINNLEKYLSYVDSWATCDTIRPKSFNKNKNDVLKHLYRWINSNEEFRIRFAIDTFMTYFLDDDYKDEYSKLISEIRSDKYYVNMMIAWYFATALAKKWDSNIKYITEYKLDKWTHNKTIRKAIESYRITNEQKTLLRGYICK